MKNFTFEYHHFAMDSREKIRAMKVIENLHPQLIDILIFELQTGNIIARAQAFGQDEIEVALQYPFKQIYDRPAIEHFIETDSHYRGDFYRVGSHAIVAHLPAVK